MFRLRPWRILKPARQCILRDGFLPSKVNSSFSGRQGEGCKCLGDPCESSSFPKLHNLARIIGIYADERKESLGSVFISSHRTARFRGECEHPFEAISMLRNVFAQSPEWFGLPRGSWPVGLADAAAVFCQHCVRFRYDALRLLGPRSWLSSFWHIFLFFSYRTQGCQDPK